MEGGYYRTSQDGGSRQSSRPQPPSPSRAATGIRAQHLSQQTPTSASPSKRSLSSSHHDDSLEILHHPGDVLLEDEDYSNASPRGSFESSTRNSGGRGLFAVGHLGGGGSPNDFSSSEFDKRASTQQQPTSPFYQSRSEFDRSSSNLLGNYMPVTSSGQSEGVRSNVRISAVDVLAQYAPTTGDGEGSGGGNMAYGTKRRSSFFSGLTSTSALNNDSQTSLAPPAAPFASQRTSPTSSSLTIPQPNSPSTSSLLLVPSSSTTLPTGKSSRPLSTNYLPMKFSEPHKQGEWAHRRKTKVDFKVDVPDTTTLRSEGRRERGGGVEEVYQNGKDKKTKLVWNRFKWMLFVSNTVLMLWSLASLILLLLIWFNIWDHSEVVFTGNRVVSIISTVTASFCVLTALIGYSGILLNNRSFLAVYNLLLWVCFAMILAPGYIMYKDYSFNLEGKINKQWSRDLGEIGRLKIQNSLNCCGYYSPFVEATISSTCYARSILPGCKGHYLRFSRDVYKIWWTVSFSLVPFQLYTMVTALLCANHVTYRFGKGLTPKDYRLDLSSLAVIMDSYATEIAQAYGPEVANDALSASSSHLEVLHSQPKRSSNMSHVYTAAPAHHSSFYDPSIGYSTRSSFGGSDSMLDSPRLGRSGLYDTSSIAGGSTSSLVGAYAGMGGSDSVEMTPTSSSTSEKKQEKKRVSNLFGIRGRD